MEAAAQAVKCHGDSSLLRLIQLISMAKIERLLTAEEYAQLPDDDMPTELVRGRIVTVDFPGCRHGLICARVGVLLANYVDERGLGYVLSNNAGIVTERQPDTVRGPDISFFSYARIPQEANLDGYAEVAPEVVFEVRSPGDMWPALLRRVSEFLNAGVLAVYVVDAKKQTITLFDPESDPPGRTLEYDELIFPEPLGGLRITVRQIFT